MIRRLHGCLAALLVLSLFNSCAFTELKKEAALIATQVSMGGEITNRSPHKKPLLILLINEIEGTKQIVNFKAVSDTEGMYLFVVPAGNYYVAAFEDANDNLTYDDGEYFGTFGGPDRISIADLKPLDDVDIDVDRTDGFPESFPKDVTQIPQLPDIKMVAFGKIASLDDEKFSQEYAKMGFWEPVNFLFNAGVGIYFLEAYDPAKTPVLFVHGASGSPRNFSYLAENIDRSRFQPWFFHYPSGIPLDKVSRFLNNLVQNLHDKYRFKQLYITAHSMGGLVSRGFILNNLEKDENDYIKLFVSISTPWNGHELVQKGVDHAPAAIPSWYDMVPDSPFIQKVFSRSLPSRIPYYLLFSHKGGCSSSLGNNDGAVSINSQLDLRAQADAANKWGFNNGHVDILSSPEVLKIYSEILDGTHDYPERRTLK